MLFRRGLRYRLPTVLLLVALLLTGTVVGGVHFTHPRAAAATAQLADPTPALLALSASAPVPTTRGLRAALDPLVRVHALAPKIVGGVADVRTGAVPYALGLNAAAPPASTTKLVTAAAALTWLGPDRVFRTRTTIGTTGRAATTVTLVGGGDPTVAGPRAALPAYPRVAHLADLAKATAAALVRRHLRAVRLAVDDTLFSGPRTAPGWKPNYLTDGDVSPVTALSVDAGRLRPDNNPRTPDDRSADPPLTAGRQFATLLARAHITVVGAVRRGRAPAGSAQLAAVTSPTVNALVTRMLQRSDNDVAEALFRHIAIARHQPATFAGGAIAVHQWLLRLGVNARAAHLVDGSGLSLRDRLTALLLMTVLQHAADDSTTQLRPIVSALPVGGFSGTLDTRYRVPPRKNLPALGAGVVRAKTGTLTGVSALAGLVVDASGRLLAFTFIADAVPLGGLTAAERALDRIAGRLSVCGCR